MQTYLLIFSLLVLASFIDLVGGKRNAEGLLRATIFLFLVAFLIIVSGLRYDTGFDYWSYFNNWWQSAQEIGNISSHQKEPLLFLLFNAFGSLGLSYQHGLLILSIISIGLKAYVINLYSPYPIVSLLIFVGDFFLLQEMGQMRSGLAMGFLVLSLHFFIRKRWLAVYLFYCLACLTHVASIPFALVYILSKIRITPSFLSITIFSALIVLFLYLMTGPIIVMLANSTLGQTIGISSYTISVLDKVEGRSLLTIGNGFSAGILIVALFLRKRIEKKIPYFREFLWAYALGVAFLICNTFLGDPSARVARMFLFYQVLLIPLMATVFSPKIMAFFLLFWGTFMYSLAKYMLVLTKRPDAFLPYTFVAILG